MAASVWPKWRTRFVEYQARVCCSIGSTFKMDAFRKTRNGSMKSTRHFSSLIHLVELLQRIELVHEAFVTTQTTGVKVILTHLHVTISKVAGQTEEQVDPSRAFIEAFAKKKNADLISQNSHHFAMINKEFS